MPASFFGRNTSTQIWKCMLGVSPAGAKRGRGKGSSRVLRKDYNRGQFIGEGRHKLVLPGLNTRITTGRKLATIEDAGPNEKFFQNLEQTRKLQGAMKKYREKPIDRGYSGRRAPGRLAGPPDDHNETSFTGFNSRVLMARTFFGMSGVMGRSRKIQALVVTGNGNGIAGFATSTSKELKTSVKNARNDAGQHLHYIERDDKHTVMHDFFSKYYQTTVFVERKPKGYGIRACRTVKSICEMAGITDLRCKAEGKVSNKINLTKAFFLGLINQKSYEKIAEEKRLHLVDLKEENFFNPIVLASPKSPVRTEEELEKSNEDTDFTFYIYDGRIKQVLPTYPSRYIGTRGYSRRLDRQDLMRNRERTKLQLAVRYGDKKVKDVFPYFISNAKSFNNPTA